MPLISLKNGRRSYMSSMACTSSMPAMNSIFWQSGSCRRTERYDGYPQLENGVGMLRLLDTEVTEALEALPEDLQVKQEELSIATGRLAYPYLRKQLDKIEAKFPQKKGASVRNPQ